MKTKQILRAAIALTLFLTFTLARADVILQPGPGANDGMDDGSAAKGKDAAEYRISVPGGAITNGGSEAEMYVYNSPCNVPVNGGCENSYLQFSMAGLPAQYVTNATIEVYCRVFYNGCGWPWPTNPVISMRRVTQPWNEMTVTAQTSPATDPSILDTHTITVVHGGTPGCPHPIFMEFEGWLSFDVTSTYAGWVSGALTNYGVEFRIDTPFCQNGDVFEIHSSDYPNAALRPKLVLRMPSAITSTNAAGGRIGVEFNYQITAYDNPTWFKALGLPAGLTINTNTGLISGTPTTEGIHSITLLAGNEVTSNMAYLNLDVLPAIPVITSSTHVTGQVAVGFTYQIVATNNPTWLIATPLPDGLAANGAGLISGIPTAAGNYSVQLFAGNRGGTNSVLLTLNILPPTPVINSPTNAAGEILKLFTYTITATNAPTTYGVSNLPSWLVFDSTSGQIRGTPTNTGRYAVQLVAFNPYGSGSTTLFLAITNPSITYTQDFENGMAGWTTAASMGGLSLWSIGDTNSGAAHGGTHFAFSGTVVGQAYASQSKWLTSIQFTAATTNAWLKFWGIYGLNDYWAYGKVLMSVNSGAYREIASYTGYPFGVTAMPGQVTSAVQYAFQQIHVGQYLNEGDTFTLQFTGIGRDGHSSPGWMIDDIAVSGVMFVPELTSSTPTNGFVGQFYSWPVISSGTCQFGATGLPAGLGIDANSGLISGIPMQLGEFNVEITASNYLGVANQTLALTVIWPPPTNSLPTNLVSWWRGETNAQDQMGVHHGTLGGGTTFTNGLSGRAFALNGANSSVGLGTWFNWQQFTLSLWVKPGASQPQYADILDNNHTGSRSWVIQSANTTNGLTSQWSWGVYGGGSINFSLTMDVWQHLVITRDSNYVSRLYLNGTLVATNAGTGMIYYDGSQNLHLGRHNNLGRYFNGQVDEVMCFNRALGANEVAYLAGRINPYAVNIPIWLGGFGLVGTNADYNVDCDRDGSKNIFEYAFNQNPTNSNSVVIPSPAINDDHLVLTFRERTGGTGTVGLDYTAGGLTYRVEAADTPSGPWTSNASLLEQVGSAVNNGDGTETVSVRLKQTTPATTKKFMRLVLMPSP